MADFVFDPSYTEDCAIVRPDRSPDDGRSSPVIELFMLLATWHGIFWLGLLAQLFWRMNGILGFLFAAFSVALGGHWVIHYTMNDDLRLGTEGGCVGSLDVTLAVLAAGTVLGLAVMTLRLVSRFRSGPSS